MSVRKDIDFWVRFLVFVVFSAAKLTLPKAVFFAIRCSMSFPSPSGHRLRQSFLQTLWFDREEAPSEDDLPLLLASSRRISEGTKVVVCSSRAHHVFQSPPIGWASKQCRRPHTHDDTRRWAARVLPPRPASPLVPHPRPPQGPIPLLCGLSSRGRLPPHLPQAAKGGRRHVWRRRLLRHGPPPQEGGENPLWSAPCPSRAESRAQLSAPPSPRSDY